MSKINGEGRYFCRRKIKRVGKGEKYLEKILWRRRKRRKIIGKANIFCGGIEKGGKYLEKANIC